MDNFGGIESLSKAVKSFQDPRYEIVALRMNDNIQVEPLLVCKSIMEHENQLLEKSGRSRQNTPTGRCRRADSPMDNAIIGLLGFGSTTMFSTIDLMGLCVRLAMSEARTFHRSRKLTGMDISSLSRTRSAPRLTC